MYRNQLADFAEKWIKILRMCWALCQYIKMVDLTIDKGHEFMQYYALGIIVGLFYNFTIVEMKGPNKAFRMKKKFGMATNYGQV